MRTRTSFDCSRACMRSASLHSRRPPMSIHSSKSIVIASVLAAAPTSRANKADKPSEIEPAAIAALHKMGAFLREQQSFTVRTNVETDYVLASGQKVRLSTRNDVRVRR